MPGELPSHKHTNTDSGPRGASLDTSQPNTGISVELNTKVDGPLREPFSSKWRNWRENIRDARQARFEAWLDGGFPEEPQVDTRVIESPSELIPFERDSWDLGKIGGPPQIVQRTQIVEPRRELEAAPPIVLEYKPFTTEVKDRRIVVSGDTSDPEKWKEVIGQMEFNGNVENAAGIMHAFSKARDHFGEMLLGTGIDVPNVSIIPNDIKGDLQIFSGMYEDSVNSESSFKKWYLENWSKYRLDDVRDLQDAYGEILFHGTVGDYFTLVGFEEAHHGVFRAVGGHIEPTVHGPAPEYHSIEVEWQALNDKIDYAKALNMSPRIIEIHEGIRDRAAEIRQAQGLPTYRVDLLTQKPLQQ